MTKFSLKEIICSIFAMCITLFLGIINVHAYDSPEYRDLLLTRCQQEQTKWCWAACAQMVANYQSYQGPFQSQIVTYVKGGLLNQNANEVEQETALEYARFSATGISSTAYTDYDTLSYDATRTLLL